MPTRTPTAVAEAPVIPRPEPIGVNGHEVPVYLVNEMAAYRLSRGVTQGQIAQYLGVSTRTIMRLEQDLDGSGRTAWHRCTEYLQGVERYVRGQEQMVRESRGRWRTAQEARAILDAQRAEGEAAGFHEAPRGGRAGRA